MDRVGCPKFEGQVCHRDEPRAIPSASLKSYKKSACSAYFNCASSYLFNSNKNPGRVWVRRQKWRSAYPTPFNGHPASPCTITNPVHTPVATP
ncbi:hypothetical protein MIZ03_1006 [Rhodoferax lithotrophicus]|uniref:Uncharacterized protein n=1 Tax=Rhodoferax lithotrophicus TaxID=2798804 RepID=A0ABM7MIP7_9BURK|nr:hypothetical protein MIZ03_1006 [Rhodoferax sp. MIZ03]